MNSLTPWILLFIGIQVNQGKETEYAGSWQNELLMDNDGHLLYGAFITP